MSNAGQLMTVRELAAELHTSKQTVQNYCDRLGLVLEIQGNRRVVTPEQAEQIRAAVRTQREGHQEHQERQQRRSSRSKADTGTTDAADSMTVDLLRDQLRHQAEEIQFLRSLVVSLQNEKSALLQLAGPMQSEQTDPGPTDENNLDPEPVPADEDPTPQPEAPQQPEQTTAGPQPEPQLGFWERFKSFFNG